VRRILSIVFAILFTLTSISVHYSVAATTIKPGSICTKKFSTKIINKKKYTCILVKKKLVWSTGAPVVNSGESISAPIETEDAKAPSHPITFDNLDTKWVRKIAIAEINSGISGSASFVPNIKFILSPNAPIVRVEKEKAGVSRASSFWADFYKPTDVNIGYFVEDDIKWVDEGYCQAVGYCTGTNSNNFPVSGLYPTGSPGCDGAFATRLPSGVQFFVQCIGRRSDSLKNRQTGPHEYFHFVQNELQQNRPMFPNWWLEGAADFFGDVMGAYDGTSYPMGIDQMQFESSYNWMHQDLCDVSTLKPEALVKCFKYTYAQAGPPQAGSKWMMAHVSYYMGSLATEAMLAVKGLSTYKAFMKDLKEMTFDQSIEKNYGLSIDDFYSKVSKYVILMYKEQR
jgi:hypothetical protein